jgi:hypothetical protein
LTVKWTWEQGVRCVCGDCWTSIDKCQKNIWLKKQFKKIYHVRLDKWLTFTNPFFRSLSIYWPSQEYCRHNLETWETRWQKDTHASTILSGQPNLISSLLDLVTRLNTTQLVFRSMMIHLGFVAVGFDRSAWYTNLHGL